MSENIILTQALWLLSIPEAAARVHGQHAKGRISVREPGRRTSRISLTTAPVGLLIARLLTEAIVFCRNAVTRIANNDLREAAVPNPLAFSDALLQSQQDVLPALSLFQRAHKAATDVTDNEHPDDENRYYPNFDGSSVPAVAAAAVMEPKDDAAARCGIAACHALLSLSHTDPRDAATSSSDALRELVAALRAAAVAVEERGSIGAAAAGVLRDLGPGCEACQACLLALLGRGLERLQRIAGAQAGVCRLEAAGVTRLMEELAGLAAQAAAHMAAAARSSGGGGANGGDDGDDGGGGGRGRGGIIALQLQRPQRSDCGAAAAAAAAAASASSFAQALQEAAAELRRGLAPGGGGFAAAISATSPGLSSCLRAARRRVQRELQRVGVTPENPIGGGGGSEHVNGGGSASVPSRPSVSLPRRRSYGRNDSGGGSGGSGGSNNSSRNSSLSGCGYEAVGAQAGRGYGDEDSRLRVFVSRDSEEQRQQQQLLRRASSSVRSGARGYEECLAVPAAAATSAAATAADATAQWLRRLPSRSDDSETSAASLSSSLLLSATATLGVATSSGAAPPLAAAAPAAGGGQSRGAVFPLAAERILLGQHRPPLPPPQHQQQPPTAPAVPAPEAHAIGSGLSAPVAFSMGASTPPRPQPASTAPPLAVSYSVVPPASAATITYEAAAADAGFGAAISLPLPSSQLLPTAAPSLPPKPPPRVVFPPSSRPSAAAAFEGSGHAGPPAVAATAAAAACVDLGSGAGGRTARDVTDCTGSQNRNQNQNHGGNSRPTGLHTPHRSQLRHSAAVRSDRSTAPLQYGGSADERTSDDAVTGAAVAAVWAAAGRSAAATALVGGVSSPGAELPGDGDSVWQPYGNQRPYNAPLHELLQQQRSRLMESPFLSSVLSGSTTAAIMPSLDTFARPAGRGGAGSGGVSAPGGDISALGDTALGGANRDRRPAVYSTPGAGAGSRSSPWGRDSAGNGGGGGGAASACDRVEGHGFLGSNGGGKSSSSLLGSSASAFAHAASAGAAAVTGRHQQERGRDRSASSALPSSTASGALSGCSLGGGVATAGSSHGGGGSGGGGQRLATSPSWQEAAAAAAAAAMAAAAVMRPAAAGLSSGFSGGLGNVLSLGPARSNVGLRFQGAPRGGEEGGPENDPLGLFSQEIVVRRLNMQS